MHCHANAALTPRGRARVFEAVVADHLARAAKGEDRDRYDGLTDREREILRLIAQA